METKLGDLLFRFKPSGSSMAFDKLRSLPTPTSKENFMQLYDVVKDNVSLWLMRREVSVIISHWTTHNTYWKDTLRYWVAIFIELNIPASGDSPLVNSYIDECKKLGQLNTLGD